MMAAQESAALSRDRLDDSSAVSAALMSPPTSAPVSKITGPSKIAGTVPPKRAGHDKHAELFRKDLISAMKLPDTEVLQAEEYVLIADSWKLEWERGVQVPVDPENIPPVVVKCVAPRPAPLSDYTVAAVADADDDINVFRLPRKFLYSCTDDNFETSIHELYFTSQQTDDVCRYDLDEVDSAWLAEFNELRETTGEEPVSEELMERVMEQLEMLCHSNLQQAIRTVDGLGIEYDENVVCDVCRSPDGEDSNEMVFCDACDICVHQACYGITNIPEGNWLCRTCALNIRPTCVLCPKTGGAMKSTKSGTKWAHISCALWIPEVTIDCPDKMEPITNISQIPSSRWALVCSLCRERVGACIQCCVKACKTSFHVTCAFQHGLDLKTTFSDDGTDVQLKAYCSKHSVGREDKQTVANGNIAAATGLLSGLERSMTDEERTELRSHRLKKLAEEFYEHVEPIDVAETLDLDIETVDFIYSYWVLKRKTGFDRPLLMPKTEEVDILTKQREDTLIARMKMFIHLRQELERVRNLCYMVNKREKTRSLLYQLKEDIFRREALLGELEDAEMESGDTCGVPQYLHRSTRTFYDEPLAILHAADRDIERGELIDRQMLGTSARLAGPTAANFIPSATDAALMKAASRRARPSSRDVAATSHGSQIQQLFRDKMDIREARGWIADEIKTDSSDEFVDKSKLVPDLSDIDNSFTKVIDSSMTDEADNKTSLRLIDQSNADDVDKSELYSPLRAGKRNRNLEIPEINKTPSIVVASNRNNRNVAGKRCKALRDSPAGKVKSDTVDVINLDATDLTSEEKTGASGGRGKVKVNDSRKSFPGRSPHQDRLSSPSKLSKLKRKSMTAGFFPGKLTKTNDAVNCKDGKRRRSGAMTAGKRELLDIIAKFEEMDTETFAEGSELNATSEETVKSESLTSTSKIVRQDVSCAIESVSSEESLSANKETELIIENIEKPIDTNLPSSTSVSQTRPESVDASCSPDKDKNISTAALSREDKIEGRKRRIKTHPTPPENVEAGVENVEGRVEKAGKENDKVVGRQLRRRSIDLSSSINLANGKDKDVGAAGQGKSSLESVPGKEADEGRRLRPVRTKPKHLLDSPVQQNKSPAIDRSSDTDEKRLRSRRKSEDSSTSLPSGNVTTRKSASGCAESSPGLPCGKDGQVSRSRRSFRMRNRIPSDSSADLDSHSVCSADMENVPLKKSEKSPKIKRKRLKSVDSESNKSSSERDADILAAEEILTVDSSGSVEKLTEADKPVTSVDRKIPTGRVDELSKVSAARDKDGITASKLVESPAYCPKDVSTAINHSSTDDAITTQPLYSRPTLAGFALAAVATDGLDAKLRSRVLPDRAQGRAGSRTQGLQCGSSETERSAGGNNDKVTSFLASLYSKLNRKPNNVSSDGLMVPTPSAQPDSETTETAVTNSRKRAAHLIAGCRSRTVGVKKPVAEVEENVAALSVDLKKSSHGETATSLLDNSLEENSLKKSRNSPLRVETLSDIKAVLLSVPEPPEEIKSMPVLGDFLSNHDAEPDLQKLPSAEQPKPSLFPPLDSIEPPPSPTPSFPLTRFEYLNGIDRVNTLFPSPIEEIKTSSLSRREGLREKLLRRFLPSQLIVSETIKSRVRNSLGLIASACALNGPSTICRHTQQKLADCLSRSHRSLTDRQRKSPTSFRHASTDDPNDNGTIVATRLLPVRQRRRKAYSEWDYVTGEDLTSPASPAGSNAASSDSDFTVEQIEAQPSDDDFSPRCHAFRGRIRRLSLPR